MGCIGTVGFIPALKGGAFSSILRNSSDFGRVVVDDFEHRVGILTLVECFECVFEPLVVARAESNVERTVGLVVAVTIRDHMISPLIGTARRGAATPRIRYSRHHRRDGACDAVRRRGVGKVVVAKYRLSRRVSVLHGILDALWIAVGCGDTERRHLGVVVAKVLRDFEDLFVQVLLID
jgi:hypothetical protein